MCPHGPLMEEEEDAYPPLPDPTGFPQKILAWEGVETLWQPAQGCPGKVKPLWGLHPCPVCPQDGLGEGRAVRMRPPGGCGADWVSDRVSDGYQQCGAQTATSLFQGEQGRASAWDWGHCRELGWAPRGAGSTLGCCCRVLGSAGSSASGGGKIPKGFCSPRGCSARVAPAVPIPVCHAGGPKAPSPISVSAVGGAHTCACVTPMCQGVTPMCQGVTALCQSLTHVLGALSRCQHSAPGSDKAPTGCDCQAELEGLEILGWIIRFHIVTAAAIGGSGRLISPPPLCSLIFIRMRGG